MIPDEEYIALYKMFDRLLSENTSEHEQRIVYYQPELFIEMAEEIIRLRKRVAALQHLEIEYTIRADENIRLIDIINGVRRECKEKGIVLDTKLNLRRR